MGTTGIEEVTSIANICDNNIINSQEIMTSEVTSTYLSMLVRCAEAKAKYKNNGFRYENSLKLIATYFFIIGGRILYETLAANLPLPSVSTISRTINACSSSLIEGTCRVIDFKQFLQARNLTSLVWLSEDATRITGRIQYDQHKSIDRIYFTV